MKFDYQDLPLQDFALLGLSQKDVSALPPQTLGAILNGGRTSLIRFTNIPSKNGRKYYVDARLSLERNSTGAVKLKMHPRQPQLKNTFGLNPAEQKYLAEDPDGFVDKEVPSMGNRKLAVYFDALTNEYIAIDRNKIIPPHTINGENLTPEQKTQFKNGAAVKLANGQISLDPTSENGIAGKGIATMVFDRYSYSHPEIFFDLTMLSAGTGAFVLLEHLLRVSVLSIKAKQENARLLNNQQVNKALLSAQQEIGDVKRNTAPRNRTIKHDDLKNIINKHLVNAGVLNSSDISLTSNEALNITSFPADADNAPSVKTPNKSVMESLPASKNGKLFEEIISIDPSKFTGKVQAALTGTQIQLNALKQLGVGVPDMAVERILSQQFSKNGIEPAIIKPGAILGDSLQLAQSQQDNNNKNAPKLKP